MGMPAEQTAPQSKYEDLKMSLAYLRQENESLRDQIEQLNLTGGEDKGYLKGKIEAYEFAFSALGKSGF